MLSLPWGAIMSYSIDNVHKILRCLSHASCCYNMIRLLLYLLVSCLIIKCSTVNSQTFGAAQGPQLCGELIWGSKDTYKCRQNSISSVPGLVWVARLVWVEERMSALFPDMLVTASACKPLFCLDLNADNVMAISGLWSAVNKSTNTATADKLCRHWCIYLLPM